MLVKGATAISCNKRWTVKTLDSRWIRSLRGVAWITDFSNSRYEISYIYVYIYILSEIIMKSPHWRTLSEIRGLLIHWTVRIQSNINDGTDVIIPNNLSISKISISKLISSVKILKETVVSKGDSMIISASIHTHIHIYNGLRRNGAKT